MAAEGFEIEADGAELGTPFIYQRGRASGLRIELIDDSIRDLFYDRWGLDR
jgi:hypothetical protein